MSPAKACGQPTSDCRLIQCAIRFLFPALLALALAACGGGGGGGDGTGDGGSGGGEVDLGGEIQKGPFTIGSSISINEQTDTLNPTGTNFETQTTNDLGAFDTSIATGATFVEVVADGFYYDEILDDVSAAAIVLRSISDLTEGGTVNINLLTSLQKDRLKALLGGGSSFADSRTESKADLLAVFGITTTVSEEFDQLSIAEEGDNNAILLAVSAVLSQVAVNRASSDSGVAGQLSEVLSTLSNDIGPDGTLEDEDLIADIRQAGIDLDLEQVRANLEERYSDEGETVTAPNFEDFVDSDGDGTLNGVDDDDPEAFSFSAQTDVEPDTDITSNVITVDGLDGGTLARLTNGRLILNGELQDVTDDSGSQDLTLVSVANGDEIAIRLRSSADFDETVTASLRLGDSDAKDFDVTTCTLAACLDGELYVDAANGDDGNLGTSDSPLQSLETAMEVAAANDVESIFVAEGNYIVLAPIELVEGVSLFGGYTNGFSAREGESVILNDVDAVSGPEEGGAIRSEAGVTSATVVDGFTLQGADGTGVGGNGPAIFIRDSSPTISNNIIIGGGNNYGIGIQIGASAANFFADVTPEIHHNEIVSSNADNHAGPQIGVNILSGYPYLHDNDITVTDDCEDSCIGVKVRGTAAETLDGAALIQDNVITVSEAGCGSIISTIGNFVGISLGSSATIDGNTITVGECAGLGANNVGIHVRTTENVGVEITRNDIELQSSGEEYGIILDESADATIAYNRIVTGDADDMGYGNNIGVWIKSDGNSHEFYNNLFWIGEAKTSAEAWGIRNSTDNASVTGTSAMFVRNNTFSIAAPTGWDVWGMEFNSPNFLVIENNIFDIPSGEGSGGCLHIFDVTGTGSALDADSVKNNDFWGCAYAVKNDDQGTSYDNGLTNLHADFSDVASGNISTNPNFDDAANGDFELSCGSSPLYYSGLDGGESANDFGFEDDLEGNIREGNGTTGWSMGAFEFDPVGGCT